MFNFFSATLARICLPFIGLVLIGILLGLRNLHGLMQGLIKFLRNLIRFSFGFYSWFLNKIRTWALYYTDIDLLKPLPRSLTTIAMNLLIGWIVTNLLGWTLSGLLVIVLILHGLFIGMAWEQITTPEGFQLGEKVE